MQAFHTKLKVVILIAAVAVVRPVSAEEDVPSFSRDIQPLLGKHCVLCHGPDEAEAGLRLDQADSASALLDSGVHAIVAGQPENSELLRRVTTDDESMRMPPDSEPLSEKEVDLLRRWIAGGARFEQHWAYRPVAEPDVPAVEEASRAENPIDSFVFARLKAAGISPSPQADRATLIKRLYYDLIGLPPAPEDVDAFLADSSDNAYEQLVDRLLASDHFGERWGRHWLDKARYADSDGYEKDRPRPNAWRYRDWVIEAINQDMPYDQFTIEQLAGDLLPNPTPMQQLATAFHRQTLTNTEGGTDQEQFRVEATFDRTETTGGVWMALTLTCARCHSHKYDQITQTEYYQLFAFFNNANEDNTDVARSHAAMEKYKTDKAAFDAKAAEAKQRYAAAVSDLQPEVERWLQETEAAIASQTEVSTESHSLFLVDAKTSGKAKIVRQDDDSLLVSGPVPDKDSYTVIFELPEERLTGLRIEVLPHETLGKGGPGRAANGNFVLSRLQAAVSDTQEFTDSTELQFGTVEADFAQEKFAPEGVLSDEEKSGWAIAPKMGAEHQLTAYSIQPQSGHKYLRVVLNQQYGGKHTLGRFRITALSGFDSLRAMPPAVAEAVRTESSARSAEQQQLIEQHVAAITPETAAMARELAALRKQEPQPPLMPVRVIVPAERTTSVLHRGDFLQPSDEVASGVLSVISSTHPLTSRQTDQPADRLDLARWLMNPAHPLTSRVTVNQVWTHLFGAGLVETVNDFGVRGDQPSHPQLLDWLAWQLSHDMQWSRKTLIRMIVTSATWKQSSHHRADLQESDPTNRLLARQNRLRVEAEIVRDLYLAASGLLEDQVGGPSVFPPLPPGVAELSYANNFKWATSKGGDAYRRGMYTFFKRTSPHPTLVSFDCPDANTTRLMRATSNTPLQALVTLNNEVYSEAAQALANRVLKSDDENDHERLARALRLCITRVPSDAEIDRFQTLLKTAREYYAAHPDDAQQLTARHAVEGVAAEDNAAWVATVRVILNLDEFIVRD